MPDAAAVVRDSAAASDRPRHRRWHQLAWAVLFLALGGLSLDRAVRGRFDFHHFYLDARYVWVHGAINPDTGLPPTVEERQLPFYLPVVPLVLSPMAAFGRLPAAILWTGGQMAALAYSLAVLRRWGTPWSLALATLLALPALVEAARFNQLSYFVLALVLGGVRALETEKPWRAGALLGAAAVLKLLPAIFLPWLLLKRRWTAAAALAGAAVLLAAVPPLIAFGPERTSVYHEQWFVDNVCGDAARGLLDPNLPEHFTDRRNQSIAQVLARLTWRGHPHVAPYQLGELDPFAAKRSADAIAVILFATLLWRTRHGWDRLTPARQHAEIAVFAIGMLVFSPLLRQYYLVWALPAVLLLAQACLTGETPGARWVGRVGLVIWVVGMIAWIWPITRVYGTHLVMLILLAGLVLCERGVASRADRAARGLGARKEEPGRHRAEGSDTGRDPGKLQQLIDGQVPIRSTNALMSVKSTVLSALQSPLSQ